jgi:hypothetical protein
MNHDISQSVFSEGPHGAVHVRAHELLEAGEFEAGRRLLVDSLRHRSGSGSAWAHLQFHAAVFEITVGDYAAAYSRLITELAPIAATSEDALTDAPAIAWRLALIAPDIGPLPWNVLQRTALRSLAEPTEPFVALHNLLAVAGAGNTAAIDAWLGRQRRRAVTAASRIVLQAAEALRAYTLFNVEQAAALCRGIVPGLPLIGGSRAQQELFRSLAAGVVNARVCLPWRSTRPRSKPVAAAQHAHPVAQVS